MKHSSLWGKYFAAALVAPVVFRTGLLISNNITPGLQDGIGFILDTFSALAVAGVLLLVTRLGRFAAPLILVIWNALIFGSYEYARMFDATVDGRFLTYVLDPTFFKGSVATGSMVSIGLVCLVMILSLGLLYRTKKQKPRYSLSVFILLLVLVLAISGGSLMEKKQTSWRSENPLFSNIGFLLSAMAGELEPDPGLSLSDRRVLNQIDKPDLSGTPITAFPPEEKPNILLIVLESVSGAYIPSVAHQQGITYPLIEMKHLDAVLSQGITYASFIAGQRQTNRGEYSLLCGDIPKLCFEPSKMNDFVLSSTRRCLPAVLKEAGYRTIYLQPAPLGFMSKDQFMPKAGFDEVLGNAWFPDNQHKNRWGVDDKSFFQGAMQKIQNLAATNEPWFLTLLTVGTHHPFHVPQGYRQDENLTDMERSFLYLDEAFGTFYEQLKASGIMENTLLIVTADESLGMKSGYDDLTLSMSQNWIFLSVVSGNVKPRYIQAPFMQSDVALSVLDYLGLTHLKQEFIGRSIFRTYTTPRPIFFTNVYNKHGYYLDTDNTLTVCMDFGNQCETWQETSAHLFSNHHIQRPDLPNKQRLLNEVINRSALSGRVTTKRSEATLRPDSVVPLNPKGSSTFILEGPTTAVASNTIVDIELVFTLKGERGQAVGSVMLKDGDDVLGEVQSRPFLVNQGQIFNISFETRELVEQLHCHFEVQVLDGGNLSLEMERLSVWGTPP